MPRVPDKKKAPARAKPSRTSRIASRLKRALHRTRPAAPRPKPAPAVPAPRSAPPRAVAATPTPVVKEPTHDAAGASLTEEEQIESAKYLPRALPRRVFEEERFLFPETYGLDRVRLLVKDPDWLFAHWDVDPHRFESLRGALGERAAALTRLTLRVSDVANGGSTMVLLPYGARSWYVRTDRRRRTYRAELGFTLPSGEFRVVAESNLVTTPPTGASRRRPTRVARYDPTRPPAAELELEPLPDAGVGSWAPEPLTEATAGSGLEPSDGGIGGASDIFRR